MEKSENLKKDILNRIGEFCKGALNSNVSDEVFYQEWETSRGQLKDMVDGTNSFNYYILESILRLHPELSAEWLLRGEGEMIKQVQEADIEETDLDCLLNMSKHLKRISESMSNLVEMKNKQNSNNQ